MYSIAMSTRGQLRFVNADGSTVAQIYKHSDCYPSNIVPMVDQLRDMLEATGWVRGPHYAAAQFIFMDKLRGLRMHVDRLAETVAAYEPDEDDYSYDRMTEALQEQDGIGPARAETAAALATVLTDPEHWGDLRQPYFLGGHGVETGNIHGDEAYIYEVMVPSGGRDDDTEWAVKVSGNRHDGAFDSPEWEGRDGKKRGYDYGPDEDAWSEAEWLFTGSLDRAMAAIEAADEDTKAADALAEA